LRNRLWPSQLIRPNHLDFSPGSTPLPSRSETAIRDSRALLRNIFKGSRNSYPAHHELGHVAITQMGLPVLGKIEDKADTFATLVLLRMGSDFSHSMLADAAEGWFLADRRDQKTGDEVAFYDEHGLNQQRAPIISCA
jgi:Putative metallopeptidase